MVTWTPTLENIIIYALGVGFSKDPLKIEDFKFTYELDENFCAFPSYGTVAHRIKLLEDIISCPGMPEFNPVMALHGEHKLECLKPFTVGPSITTEGTIIDVNDKGKGCLLTY